MSLNIYYMPSPVGACKGMCMGECVCVCVHIQCHSAPVVHPEYTVPQQPCSPGWSPVTTAYIRTIVDSSTSCLPLNLSLAISSVLEDLFPAALLTQPPCTSQHCHCQQSAARSWLLCHACLSASARMIPAGNFGQLWPGQSSNLAWHPVDYNHSIFWDL